MNVSGGRESEGQGGWGVAWRIARRELRDSLGRGLGGFRILIACLALGVAAIAAVGATRAAVEEGISRDARRLLGGDIEARLLYREASAAQKAFLASLGQTTRIAEMRSMAKVGDKRQLAALKAVDENYPLFGGLTLEPAIDPATSLGLDDGAYGAAVDPSFLDATGLELGGRFEINRTQFEIRALVREETDRGIGILTSLGPRILIDHAGLEATGLVTPGALITWRYRVALADGDVAGARAALEEAFGDPGWRLRTADQASPNLQRTVARLSLFLTLAGLAALLVGGVGAANAVKAYMDGRARAVAILKCLGAPAHVIFRAYLMQVGLIAGGATLVGVVLGGLAPAALSGVLGDMLGVRLQLSAAIWPLVLAAAFGLLAAFVFALWPLAAAERLPAARLIGGAALGVSGVRPSRRRMLWLAAAGLALAALAIFSAADRAVAAGFVVGSAIAAVVFLLAALALIRLARRAPKFGGPLWRLAVSGLARPGAPTLAISLSLGLGLAALTATTLTEAAFRNQIDQTVAESAPTFFFIDIQPAQREPFRRILADIPGVAVEDESPMLRARIVKIAGVPAAEAPIAPDVRWAIRNERGLTFAAAKPANAELVAGDWWPEDYAGPPKISFDARIAEGFGVGVGDEITFNLLGREITAEIASLRQVNYGSFAMNFSTVFDPATLSRAPHTVLATATAPPDQETAVTRAVTDALPNVTVIRVQDAVDFAKNMLDRIAGALAAVAGVAVAAGGLTLAGAVAASQQRRVREAILLKTAGADRHQIVIAQAIEFGLIGVMTAGLAMAVGAAGAWGIVTFLLQTDWSFDFAAAFTPALLACLLALAAGAIGVWRALGVPVGPTLRNA